MRFTAACLAACLSLAGMTSATNAADVATSVAATDTYKLGPGDKLKITVFNEPTLTGTYTLTSAGAVSMSLIGNVPAVGLSLEDLQQTLTQRLSAFVKQPRVSVETESYRPYYILGEVNKPGEYPYANGLRAEQAIAAAGGFTYRANRGTIFLLRADGRREVRLRMKDGRVPVLPGDTIRIGERFF